MNTDDGLLNIYVEAITDWINVGGTGSAGPTGPSQTAPAISAHWGGTTYTLAAGSWTKIRFDVETTDTDATFDNVNYVWTPAGSDANFLGYYNVNARLGLQTATNYVQLAVYRNGSVWKYGSGGVGNNFSVSTMVPISNQSDTISIYAFNGSASTVSVAAGSTVTWINGTRGRTA